MGRGVASGVRRRRGGAAARLWQYWAARLGPEPPDAELPDDPIMAAEEAAAEEEAAAVEAVARQYWAARLGPEPPDAELPDDPIMAVGNVLVDVLLSMLKNIDLPEQKIMQTPESIEQVRLEARVSKLEKEVSSIVDHTSRLRAKQKGPSAEESAIKKHMVPDLSRVCNNVTMSDHVGHNMGAGLSTHLLDICNGRNCCMNAQVLYTHTSEHFNSMNVSGSFDTFASINSERKCRSKMIGKLRSMVYLEALAWLRGAKVAVATMRELVVLGGDVRSLWMWLFGI